MKRPLLALAGITILGITVSLFSGQLSVTSNQTGAPGPGTCTSCHGTSLMTDASTTLVLTDSAGNQVTTYQPGKVYNLAMGMSKSGIVKFGFALSTTKGTLSITPSDSRVQKISTYLTHTFSGTAAITSGVAGWTGRWTAPAAGSGAANFTLFINATNNNSDDDAGDQIFSKSVSIAQGAATGIEEATAFENVHVFPSPASSFIQLAYSLKSGSDVRISLFDMQGKEVEQLHSGFVNAGAQSQTFSFSNSHDKGIYFVKLQSEQGSIVKKIIVQ